MSVFALRFHPGISALYNSLSTSPKYEKIISHRSTALAALVNVIQFPVSRSRHFYSDKSKHRTLYTAMTSKTEHKISEAEMSHLTRDGLVYRIRALEEELYRVHAAASSQGVTLPPRVPSPRPVGSGHNTTQKKSNERSKKPQPFETRLVALKLAYLGKNYGGFEFQTNASLESVEEVLWKALVKACLIVPEDESKIDWTPFEYAKSGRTDRGVSAFGQVISIRLRSSKPVPKLEAEVQAQAESGAEEDREAEDTKSKTEGEEANAKAKPPEPKREWHPVSDEIQYPRVLNRLLPSDIRVLAWCPSVPENFHARYSCGERRYRYFFTQPAFAPLPAALETQEMPIHMPRGKKRARSPSPSSRSMMIKKYKEGWLDIEAMRKAAKFFVGKHDFRNFCRIDGSRQIIEYKRELFNASIDEVEHTGTELPYVTGPAFAPPGVEWSGGRYPKVYAFNVYGNAFLWHQIRCMVAVLFHVGQGLERPEVVKDLLDVEKNPRKPQYGMADGVPLVLWDCLYPVPGQKRGDSLDWIWNGDFDLENDHGFHGLYDHLWTMWRERKMDELLVNRLLDVYSRMGNSSSAVPLGEMSDDLHQRRKKKDAANSYRLYRGGNSGRSGRGYVPMRLREQQLHFQEVNDIFARKRGFASSEEMKTGADNWLAEIRAKKAAEMRVAQG